ncbi:MAG TPA: hypothetical protein VN306_19880 [Mycobacterium sp.]|nr:hypothetical protein [Mycobacterium sp.]
MAELNMEKLREYAAEFGYWPATTDPADIERHRRLNAALDKAPTQDKIQRKFAHMRREQEQAEREQRMREEMADLYDELPEAT